MRNLAKAPKRQAAASVLTNGLDGRHWTPAWSPSGAQLAIMAEIDDNTDVWLIRPDGGEAVNLTNNLAGDGEPAWSPDGKHLVFISDRDGPVSLYIMDADGKNVRRLTDDEVDYAHPHWTAQ